MSDLAPNQRIHDVLKSIHRGRYRIPNIQRGFEWDVDRVTKLLDSVMSGYPFGAVMVWRPSPEIAGDIPTRRFIQHFDSTENYLADPELPAAEDAYLVLDGQQRLQSLYISFFGTFDKRAVYLQIDHIPTEAGDDTDYRFEFLTAEQAKGHPDMVALGTILKLDADTKYDFVQKKAAEIVALRGLVPEVASKDIEKRIARNVDRFIERFNMQDALLFQEVSEKHDYDHVLEIFERVNSGGMVLDRSDLLFSTLKLKLQKMEQSFTDTIAFLSHGDRYEFNTDFLIKSCLVVFDQRARYEVAKLKNDGFVASVDSRFKEVDYCLRHLSTWLDEAARIRCSRFLRSRLALIPLLDWMMLSGNHDKPDGENARAMTEYLYMAFFRRLFRAADRVLDQLHGILVDAVKKDKTRFPIEQIRAYAVDRQYTPWTLQAPYFGDDADLMLNIVDGGVLQFDPALNRPTKDLKLEVDHIYPKTPLGKIGLGDVVNHIGNYRLVVMPVNRRKLAKMPDDQTAFFGRKDGDVEKAYGACRSQIASGVHLGREQFLAFRNQRAQLIRQEVSAFLGVPLTPDVAS